MAKNKKEDKCKDCNMKRNVNGQTTKCMFWHSLVYNKKFMESEDSFRCPK